MKLRRARSLVYLAIIPLFSSCGIVSFGVPDMSASPVDTTGFEIQPLPITFAASFARGNDVYLLHPSGNLWKYNDNIDDAIPLHMGRPFDVWGRCIFVSKTGAIFASATGLPLVRSTDEGRTYQTSLNIPVWRMDEDDAGNLYAGNYTKDAAHVATLYKSTDGGDTWTAVWQDAGNHHIHTVRWDDRVKRLYIAFGDGPSRGQAVSNDRGTTWEILDSGPDQGHTDVAFCQDSIVWASDDQSGRVESIDKRTGRTRLVDVSSQFMWFAVSDARQVFVGTAVSRAGQRACLLASRDQGQTWQKVLESPEVATKDYSDGMGSESRYLSANRWLYFSRVGNTIQSYRIRAIP